MAGPTLSVSCCWRYSLSFPRFLSGKTSKETARELGISPETVHVHTSQVYQKLRIHSQVNLVRCILTLGQASV